MHILLDSNKLLRLQIKITEKFKCGSANLSTAWASEIIEKEIWTVVDWKEFVWSFWMKDLKVIEKSKLIEHSIR